MKTETNFLPETDKKSDLGRRDFIKLGGILTAGVAFASPAWSMLNNHRLDFSKSASAFLTLTPFILMNKAVKLAKGHAELSSDLHWVLNHDIEQLVPGNSFYMGMDLPFTNKEIVMALAKLRDKSNKNLVYKESQRLALLAGALTYNALQDELESLNNQSAVKGFTDDELWTYRDAALLQDYYTKGKGESAEHAKALSELLKEMVPRTFTRFHTIMPDDERGIEWVLQMQDWRKYQDAYYDRLGSAIMNPDKEKHRRIVEESGFYDKTEPVLSQVSTFNRISAAYGDEAAILVDLEGGLTDDKIKALHQKGKSIVAKSLISGYLTLLMINEYWTGTKAGEEWFNRMKT